MSVQITSSGSTARTAYFNTVDTGEVDPYDVREGEIYYVECWIQAKSTNTGLGTVELVVQTNGSTITALTSTTITSGTKGTWISLSSNYTVGSGVTTVSFGVRLAASATTSNDIFYVDDMLVRETTAPQNTIDSVASGLNNSSTVVAGKTTTDVLGLSYGTANTLTSVSAAVEALKSQNGGSTTSGNNAAVDFSLRADADNLGSDFTQTYSGSGTSKWGIVSGQAAWLTSGSAARSCIAVYNAVQTSTDYQKVGFTASTTNAIISGFAHKKLIFGRMNSAGTDYVYASIDNTGYVELGCVVSGSKTVWSTSTATFALTAGSTMLLYCGTTNGSRRYKVSINGKFVTWTGGVTEYVESGTSSQLDSTHRYTGMGSETNYYSLVGYTLPPRCAAFAMSDNTPGSYLGSGFRRSRISTTNVNATSGTNLFPNNFFDNAEIKTSDFTYAENTNNKLTVSVTGWYLVSVSVLFSTGIKADRFYMTLYKNGSVVDRNGTTAWGQDSGISGADAASGMFLVYCAKNDYLQPGYTISASITGLFDGEATGTQTYWSVAFLGNTKPLEPTTT